MANSKEKLFADFAPVSTQEWLDKINVDLKGADFEKKLVWKTNEGFKVKPFYRKEDLENLKTTEALPGEFPYLRGTKKSDNTWLVRQDIKVDCPKEPDGETMTLQRSVNGGAWTNVTTVASSGGVVYDTLALSIGTWTVKYRLMDASGASGGP